MKGWPVSLENLSLRLKTKGTRYNFFSIQTWTNMYVYNSYIAHTHMLYIVILNHHECRAGRWCQGSHCQNERPQTGRVWGSVIHMRMNQS